MTQLTTTKINICPGLSKEESLIIQAYSGTKVKVLTKKDLATELNDAITKVYNYCRYSIPVDSDLKIMVDDMVKDVLNYFNQVSIEEINQAFHNGARKMYGEFAGISNAVMFGWLQNYVSSTQRSEAIKKQREFLNPPPKVLTAEEKLKIINDGCLLVFEKHKKEGWTEDIGNVNYNYLDSLGVFQWAKGRKFDFIRQAQEVLRLETQNALESCADNIERAAIRKRLEEVNNAQSDRVKSMAKRIALNEFFKSLVEVGEELQDRINQKQLI